MKIGRSNPKTPLSRRHRFARPGLVVIVGMLFTFLKSVHAAELSKISMDEFMIKRGYFAVPLKHGEQNRFYCYAKVNGAQMLSLIDTGAADLVIDRRKATSLRSLATRQEARYGILDKLTGQIETVLIEKLSLAGTVISNQSAITLDLHKDRAVHTGSYIPSSNRSQAEDLILGQSFLTAS